MFDPQFKSHPQRAKLQRTHLDTAPRQLGFSERRSPICRVSDESRLLAGSGDRRSGAVSRSAQLQIPNTKLQRISKLQTPTSASPPDWTWSFGGATKKAQVAFLILMQQLTHLRHRMKVLCVSLIVPLRHRTLLITQRHLLKVTRCRIER